ncbi:COP9 signalosome [Aspergillus ambiguus]|uniref:CSN8/PSMD8/EIF3K family protein n=1 Tax=Aspergillus ambiguus TaxID=176160 RepID=UPI003CCE2ED9
MDLPSLSAEQLSAVLNAARSPTELHKKLSAYEAQACLLSVTDGDHSDLISLFYSAFFFSHLLTDQINEARAMTQRVPEDLSRNDPTLQNCLTLLRAVWQRKYEQVYTILRQLPWPETLKPIVNSYEVYFQEKTLNEVSRAYGAIRPAAAAGYLGLDTAAGEKGDPAVIQKFTACGWTWDEKAKLLCPKPIPTDPANTGHLSNELSHIMSLIGRTKS